MKFSKYFFLLSFSLISVLSFGQKDLKAYLTYTLFNNPKGLPYLETHLMVRSNSAEYKTIEGNKKQASINVQFIFSKDGEIVKFDKYTFNSPILEGKIDANANFMDQQRYSLENGKYEFAIEISDANNPTGRKIKTNVPLVIEYKKDAVSISGVELVESFAPTNEVDIWTKAGLKLVPYMLSYYPITMEKLGFYIEIYNTNLVLEEGEDFLLKYYIKNTDNDMTIPSLSKFEKIKAKEVIPIMRQFDIQDLPSGNYSLYIEVRDQENKLLGFNSMDLIRSNPKKDKELDFVPSRNFASQFTNEEELADIILSLIPIASETEGHTIRSLVKLGGIDKMQSFLYDFWLSRYSLNAESKFIEYRNRVDFVNEEFSTPTKRGYESDRGYVYLKYGIPYSRLERHDNPQAFPYEIWHYYSLPDNQKDIRFVFYTRVETSNDYELVHSTAKGELSNQGWKTIVLRGDTPTIKESQYSQSKNKINTGVIWGSTLEDDYNMPR